MNWIELFRVNRAALVHRLSGHIEDPAHDTFADGHRDWAAAVGHFEAALQALGPGHGDGPHRLVPKVLLHFERQLRGLPLNFAFYGQRVVDRGNGSREFNVNYGSHDFNNFSFVQIHSFFPCLNGSIKMMLPQSDWPPAISSNSFVMLP